MKHTPSTRVFVAGEDISRYVTRADLHQSPGEVGMVTVTLIVDRLDLSTTLTGGQVLEIHVAEEK